MTKKTADEHRYLVCVNGEAYSRTALERACELAKLEKASIILLHVMEKADYQGFGAVADKIRQEKQSETKALLKELSELVQTHIKEKPKLLMREGAIDDEIIDAVETQKNISMVIAGCAAESVFKSKTIPSLVSHLGQKLAVPVLVVPGKG